MIDLVRKLNSIEHFAAKFFSFFFYLDKKQYSFTDVRRICAQLSACGLLLLDKSSNSIARQSVRLSMPIHLLIFALKNNNS